MAPLRLIRRIMSLAATFDNEHETNQEHDRGRAKED